MIRGWGVDLSRITSVMSRKQIVSIVGANARINLWDGAIGSGKTIASLLRWPIYVASAPLEGELVVIGKTSHTLTRNVFEPLQNSEQFGDLASQMTYTAGAPSAMILGRQVRVIGANHARAESRLRGMTCAGAYVNEASLVPSEFWVQLLSRMSVPELFATTNPDNRGHWLRRDYFARTDLDLRNCWRPGPHPRHPPLRRQTPVRHHRPVHGELPVQAFRDGLDAVPGDNAVQDGIRMVCTLLARRQPISVNRSGQPITVS